MIASVAAPQDPESRLPARGSFFRRMLVHNVFWVFAVNTILIIVFTILSRNNTFFSPDNIRNLMADSATALLLGIAIAFLLGAGEFDISLGANLILSSVVAGKVSVALQNQELFVIVISSLSAAIVTGMIVGLFNGLVVTHLRVNSLIATLASLGIFTGLADIVSNGTDVTGIPQTLQDGFGLLRVADMPVPFLVSIVLWVIAWLFLKYTRFGLHVLAMGSSRTAADRAGLKTGNKITRLFVVCGALAGVAGFLDITRFAATNIAGHTQDSLAAITAAVIGGSLLAGGVVSIVGLLGGVILAVILANGLIVIGVPSYYQLVVVGVILIIAVWLDQLKKTEKSIKMFAR